MLVETALFDDVAPLKNIPFKSLATTQAPYQDIPARSVVIPLSDEVLFLTEKVTTKRWGGDLRELPCRPMRQGESFTVTL